MIFSKGAIGKEGSLQQCWENWIPTCKRMNLDPCLTSYTKVIQNGLKT